MTALGVGPLAGRYALEQLLARGGMGEVWRARDLVLDRLVAVKMLRPEHLDDAEFRDRFRAEARHAGALSHPGIAAVYDYGEQDGGSAWLVMELVEGEPLSQVLARGQLDVRTTLDVVRQTALALQAAHASGVVHRDVKPGNLMIRADGVVKVTDFGIASTTGGVPLAEAGVVVGTAYYLSPEQAGGGPVTGASDLYALGVVAYECLSGRRPFGGDDADAVAAGHLHLAPPALPEEVPERVRDLVGAAMAKDPAARPASAADLARDAAALSAALSGRRRVPGTTRTRPGSRERHHRGARLAAPLLVVVAVALGARACLTTPEGAEVPPLRPGTTVQDARATLERAGLRAQQRLSPSGEQPLGSLLGTDPAAGTRLRPGALVTLLVSAGPPS